MLTLQEVLDYVQFIRPEIILLGLFITASIILIARDWRFLILALLAQYILVGMILSRLVQPDLAVLGVLIGAFICPVLFLSARQVSVSPLSVYHDLDRGQQRLRWLNDLWRNFSIVQLIKGGSPIRGPDPTGFIFRLFVGLLMILVALSLSRTFPLPELSPQVTTAIYWLIVAGLITLTLTEDPLKAGHGLFTVLTGFGIFYATVESSLLLTGLWGSVNLLIALAIGYLTVVKGAGPEEET
jgi:hypothetical protein